MELKDKKVDRMIDENTFKVESVFYSPISAWITFLCLLLLVSIPSAIAVIHLFISEWSAQTALILLTLYLIISYIIIVALNRSFALTSKEFLIINSQFPFRRIEKKLLVDIEEIVISSDRRLVPLVVFGLLHSNYIEIKTRTSKKRYYCLFLDVDSYDENWTKKTLDDLSNNLKAKQINVKMMI